MTRLARAFVAVAPPPEVLDAIEHQTRPITAGEPHLRWLPRSHWHVTLQFLGAVPDAEPLAHTIAAAVATTAPFSIQLTGSGAFPSPRRASVLWLGIEPDDALSALAHTVTTATRALGYQPETRPYHPHLTLARVPKPRPVTRAVDQLGTGPMGPPWTVRDVHLVESDTRPDGAVHTPRAVFPLDAAGA